MATKAITIQELGVKGQEHNLVTWAALANGDDGTPFPSAGRDIKSVQIAGTLGAGGTILIEGSNDGVTYYTLDDTEDAALSINALGIYQIRDAVRYIRPRVSAGDGTTALVPTLIAR